jgi:hypothetical protein
MNRQSQFSQGDFCLRHFSVLVLISLTSIFFSGSMYAQTDSSDGSLAPQVDVADCPEESCDQLTICDLKILINNCSDLLGRKIRSNRLKNYTKADYDGFATAIKNAVESLPVLESSTPPDIEKLTLTYSTLLATQDSFSGSFMGNSEIRFVGTGDIQKALSDNSEVPANAGFGVTYERDFGDQSVGFSRIQIEASINVATTVDSLSARFDSQNAFLNQTDFGNSLLIPINSGQAAYFNIITYLNWNVYDASKNTFIPGIISGFNLNLTASNRNWEYNNDIRKMTALSFKLGVFKEFFPFFQRNPDYSITLGFNGTLNKLLGDAALDRDLRLDVLGTEQRSFWGMEIVASIRLKNLKGEIAIPFIKKKDDITVDGLTGGRLITRIRFTGGFPISLK